MKHHYCKVGSSRPALSESYGPVVLQLRYRDFLAKAAAEGCTDAALREFFIRKAEQLKRLLDTLA